MNKQKEKVMKKLIYILFTSLYVAVTACSKIDYKINDAYETAAITGITLYAVSDKPVNIIESFEIDTENASVYAFVPEGTDLTHLRLVLTISTGASLTPVINGFTDLSSPQKYTVTSPNGIVQKSWTIHVATSPQDGQ
jgi:lipoprotein